MIRGVHGLLYSSDPEATRAFFRNQVRLPGSDIGGGWWIFDFAEGDLGVHPSDGPATVGKHDVSLYCDDIHGTVASMKSRGVKFTHAVVDQGYGFVTYFRAPGGLTVQLYEPKYLKGAAAAAAKAAAAGGKRAKPAAAKRAPAPGKRATTAKPRAAAPRRKTA
mgnify:CR=1 FL=1